MTTYSLDLAFVDGGKSKLPHGPVAEIYVKTHTRRTEQGALLITPECVSFSELEEQIDRLKEELEAIRDKARAKFAAEAARFLKLN